MNILAYDPFHNPIVDELGGKYVSLDELYAHSDVITLHCPSKYFGSGHCRIF